MVDANVSTASDLVNIGEGGGADENGHVRVKSAIIIDGLVVGVDVNVRVRVLLSYPPAYYKSLQCGRWC